MPYYTDLKIMTEKILIAINQCANIDADFEEGNERDYWERDSYYDNLRNGEGEDENDSSSLSFRSRDPGSRDSSYDSENSDSEDNSGSEQNNSDNDSDHSGSSEHSGESRSERNLVNSDSSSSNSDPRPGYHSHVNNNVIDTAEVQKVDEQKEKEDENEFTGLFD